uniref:Glucoside xylosyltransferase 1 n=1 Tax=Macaca fascicularis TaxID=9541 RepID=A0A7N9DHF8_MACFA
LEFRSTASRAEAFAPPLSAVETHWAPSHLRVSLRSLFPASAPRSARPLRPRRASPASLPRDLRRRVQPSRPGERRGCVAAADPWAHGCRGGVRASGRVVSRLRRRGCARLGGGRGGKEGSECRQPRRRRGGTCCARGCAVPLPQLQFARAGAAAAETEERGWGDAALPARRRAVFGLRLLLASLRFQSARRILGRRSGWRWREAAGRGGFLARGRRTRRRERHGRRGPRSASRRVGQLILKEVDSLLYVDTDILFLRPVDDIWSLLKKFNSTQIAAMAPEHEEPRIGWYNRFARHPYYGKTGVNSGVMLMNMTRMRRKYFKNDMTTVRLQWGDILMPLLKKYKLNITWGDQDLLNIVFFHNPESLFVFPCQWNYRPDHCIYGSNCQEAEEEGIFILHGNRGVYHDDKQPAFRAVYEALRNCSFEDDNIRSLLKPLELELQKTVHTYCGKIYKIFIKQLAKSVRDRYATSPKEK